MGDVVNFRARAVDPSRFPVEEPRPIPRGWVWFGAALAAWAITIGAIALMFKIGGVPF